MARPQKRRRRNCAERDRHDEGASSSEKKNPFLRKRNYALVFGYSGKDRSSRFRQLPHEVAGKKPPEGSSSASVAVRTVEGELEKVLNKVGGISDANFGILQNCKWSRVARTDKGVHAVCQVVSLKLTIDLGEGSGELKNQSEEGLCDESITVVPVAARHAVDKEICTKEKKKRRIESEDCPSPSINPLFDEEDMSQSKEESQNTSPPVSAEQNCAGHNTVKGHSAEDDPTANFSSTEGQLEPVQDSQLEGKCLAWGKKEQEFCNNLQLALDEAKTGIKVYRLYRVTKSFDARWAASKRQYKYILPMHVLRKVSWKPAALSSPEYRFYYEMTDSEREKEAISDGNSCNNHCSNNDETEAQVAGKKFSDYINSETNDETIAATTEEIAALGARVEQLLQTYIGTHSFHNFTRGANALNPNVVRHMEVITVEPRKLHDSNSKEVDVLEITIKGQSFLLNQIRKMIGLVVEIIRGTAPPWAIIDCLSRKTKRNIHLAPAEGLFLYQVFYDGYNQHRAAPPLTPKLDFDEIKPQLDAFKDGTILPLVARDLLDGDVWEIWVRDCNRHPYFVENYPPESMPAAIKKD